MYKKLFFGLLSVNILLLGIGMVLLIRNFNLVKMAFWRLKGKNENRWQVEVEKHQLYNTKVTKVNCIMLGNSITQQAQWNELLGRDDVLNRGISGDVTQGMLQRLPEIISLKPRLIFIMAGINDIVFRSRQPEDIFVDYKRMLNTLEQQHIEPVVTSTLFVTYDADANVKVAALNKLLQHYCKEQGLRFIDLNAGLSENNTLLEKYTFDGLHLNAAGYAVWKPHVEAIIREKIDHP
jgi:lysophospholipase L1-like esterase